MSRGIDLDHARAPDGMRLFAIGDVHGRLDLLETMHELIRDDLARDPPQDWRIVHVGDYVDRGAQSAGVLDFLIEASGDRRILCLRGNHDQGFLDFLADPDDGWLFMRYGGLQTAASYGIGVAEGDLAAAHAEIAAAVPAGHRAFLEALTYSTVSGDFFFCHAGIRPDVALDRQTPEDLMWIRTEFLHHPGLFDKIVVHGHTICRDVELQANRVNVDTGAWSSGRLSALVVDGTAKRVLTAGT